MNFHLNFVSYLNSGGIPTGGESICVVGTIPPGQKLIYISMFYQSLTVAHNNVTLVTAVYNAGGSFDTGKSLFCVYVLSAINSSTGVNSRWQDNNAQTNLKTTTDIILQ